MRGVSSGAVGFARVAEFVGGAPSPFARDQLVAAVHLANNQRLDDSVFPNRIDQFLQSIRGKFLARLERTRRNRVEVDPMNIVARKNFRQGRGRARSDQCTEAFAKCRFCH